MILGFVLLGVILFAAHGLVGIYARLIDRIAGPRGPP